MEFPVNWVYSLLKLVPCFSYPGIPWAFVNEVFTFNLRPKGYRGELGSGLSSPSYETKPHSPYVLENGAVHSFAALGKQEPWPQVRFLIRCLYGPPAPARLPVLILTLELRKVRPRELK